MPHGCRRRRGRPHTPRGSRPLPAVHVSTPPALHGVAPGRGRRHTPSRHSGALLRTMHRRPASPRPCRAGAGTPAARRCPTSTSPLRRPSCRSRRCTRRPSAGPRRPEFRLRSCRSRPRSPPLRQDTARRARRERSTRATWLRRSLASQSSPLLQSLPWRRLLQSLPWHPWIPSHRWIPSRRWILSRPWIPRRSRATGCARGSRRAVRALFVACGAGRSRAPLRASGPGSSRRSHRNIDRDPLRIDARIERVVRRDVGDETLLEREARRQIRRRAHSESFRSSEYPTWAQDPTARSCIRPRRFLNTPQSAATDTNCSFRIG